ncbi:MAG: AAA family ATPase, partial [Fusobacteriaceae bacterium]
MRPSRLKMRGIGPYAKQVDIDFSSLNANGLFLITGATGAGKTSIFDGITYALYGKTNLNDDEKLNGILSDYIDADDYKNAFVEFSFELDGIDYKVKRTPKYPYINRNGKEASKAETCTVEFKDKIIDNKSEVERCIEEIIKLSYPQFKKIMMLAQGSFNEFIKSNSNDKASILNQIFETDIYEKFEEKLKEKKDDLNKKLETERNKAIMSIKSLKIDKEEWKNILKQEYIDYKNIEIILNEEIELEKTKGLELKNKKNGLNDKRDKIKKEKIEIEILNKGIDFLREIEDNYKIILEKSEDIKNLKNEEKKHQNSLKMKSSVDAHEKLFKDLSDNTKKLEEWNRKTIIIKNENEEDISKVIEYKIQLKEIEIQVEKFKKLDYEKKDHDKLIEEEIQIEKKIEKIKIEFSMVKEKKLELEKKLEKLDREKKITFEKVELREELDKEISELKIKIKNIESIMDVLNKKNESNQLLDKLKIEELKEKEKVLEALEEYDNLSKLWFQNEAYKLSAELKTDEPCPVCGSKEHPNPVKKPENLATEK